MKGESLRASAKFPLILLLPLALLANGCAIRSQSFNHGAVLSDSQVEMIPNGSSKEHVLLTLGTPSTVGEFDENVYYYITQKRKRSLAFQTPRDTNRRVVAIHFNGQDVVERVEVFGPEQGKQFEFVSRTTPTGGSDPTLLGQILRNNQNPQLPSPGGQP